MTKPTIEEFKAAIQKALDESEDPYKTAEAICATRPGLTLRLPAHDCQCETAFTGIEGGGVEINFSFGPCHDNDPELKRAVLDAFTQAPDDSEDDLPW
jgi:hypothetical protein